MAATETKPATEEAKMDLFEDDDEFEEFEIDLGNNSKQKLLIITFSEFGLDTCFDDNY